MKFAVLAAKLPEELLVIPAAFVKLYVPEDPELLQVDVPLIVIPPLKLYVADPDASEYAPLPLSVVKPATVKFCVEQGVKAPPEIVRAPPIITGAVQASVPVLVPLYVKLLYVNDGIV